MLVDRKISLTITNRGLVFSQASRVPQLFFSFFERFSDLVIKTISAVTLKSCATSSETARSANGRTVVTHSLNPSSGETCCPPRPSYVRETTRSSENAAADKLVTILKRNRSNLIDLVFN
jgi:hypothetical protein